MHNCAPSEMSAHPDTSIGICIPHFPVPCQSQKGVAVAGGELGGGDGSGSVAVSSGVVVHDGCDHLWRLFVIVIGYGRSFNGECRRAWIMF